MPVMNAPSRLGDLSPVALMHLDARRRIVDANIAAETLLKHSRRSLSGRPLSEVIYHHSPLFELIDRAQNEAGDVSAPKLPLAGPGLPGRLAANVTVRLLDEGDFILALTNSPVRDGADAAAGVAAFGRILGHEVKNPLAGIVGAAQLLERQNHAGQDELLGIITSEARRIERLINRLSAFELFSAPRMKLFNIHALLDRVISSERAAMGSRVQLRRDFDPSLPDVIGDEDHLQQAFQNIVRNACEAAFDGAGRGEVGIRTAYAAGLALKQARLGPELRRAILVSVEDNGAGIPRERQSTMFELFQSSKSGARGLGLSVVSEVVAAHGGQIRVDSEPGATRFTVLLPLIEG